MNLQVVIFIWLHITNTSTNGVRNVSSLTVKLYNPNLASASFAL